MEKDFIGFAVLSTTLFPLKVESQTTKEFLMKDGTDACLCFPLFIILAGVEPGLSVLRKPQLFQRINEPVRLPSFQKRRFLKKFKNIFFFR